MNEWAELDVVASLLVENEWRLSIRIQLIWKVRQFLHVGIAFLCIEVPCVLEQKPAQNNSYSINVYILNVYYYYVSFYLFDDDTGSYS